MFIALKISNENHAYLGMREPSLKNPLDGDFNWDCELNYLGFPLLIGDYGICIYTKYTFLKNNSTGDHLLILDEINHICYCLYS